MKKPVQFCGIKGTVNGVPSIEENIIAGSLSIMSHCSDASNGQIGQVHTGELKISLAKGLNLSR